MWVPVPQSLNGTSDFDWHAGHEMTHSSLLWAFFLPLFASAMLLPMRQVESILWSSVITSVVTFTGMSGAVCCCRLCLDCKHKARTVPTAPPAGKPTHSCAIFCCICVSRRDHKNWSLHPSMEVFVGAQARLNDIGLLVCTG